MLNRDFIFDIKHHSKHEKTLLSKITLLLSVSNIPFQYTTALVSWLWFGSDLVAHTSFLHYDDGWKITIQ